ncbi:MAG: ABC transporter ATP-binding protein [Gammaproteobacteria bacterium]|nr:ABC transporter ATP-binding protein [Gammaproteobacteria bacterium]
MNALLQASNLTRNYGDYRAVDDVSITLNSGDILGLLGPNGAGKTSTMGMLTGNLASSSGEILIKGTDLADDPKQAKRSIGYLPEQPPVYRDLTVNEYLAYAARLHNIRGSAVSTAVKQACERTGLSEVVKRLIGNLSKGFQQRVGIAQAIIHEPDVIILDEPTVGLDPIQIREIRELIRELGTRHGVILSTHILPEVQTVCNRIHILHQGRIVYDDADAEKGDTAQLTVQFNQDVDIAPLQALADVHSIDHQESGRYLIQYQTGSNPANAIAHMAVEKQWGLQELTPNSMGLEHIFVSLTQGEEQDSETEKMAEADQ